VFFNTECIEFEPWVSIDLFFSIFDTLELNHRISEIAYNILWLNYILTYAPQEVRDLLQPTSILST